MPGIRSAVFRHYQQQTDRNAYAFLVARLSTNVVIAALSYLLISGSIGKLADLVILVFAIVLGFSFTALFFVVTYEPRVLSEDSREKAIRAARLETLTGSLFYSLSFLIVVMLVTISVSVVLLVSDDLSERILDTLSWLTGRTVSPTVCSLKCVSISQSIVHMAYLTLVVESFRSFVEVLRNCVLFLERIRNL